eukprot:6750362-Prorocentrum_lima.AAC.1
MWRPPSDALKYRVPGDLPEGVAEVKAEHEGLGPQRRVGLDRLGHLLQGGRASDAILPGSGGFFEALSVLSDETGEREVPPCGNHGDRSDAAILLEQRYRLCP